MIYVGIDIAKNKHDIHIFNSETGEVINSHFRIDNSADGFDVLKNAILSFSLDSVRIGMEATGHYHLNLAYYLFEVGYSVGIINPLQTAALRRVNIRKTKTDKIDAMVIVQAMLSGYATPFHPKGETYDQLRALSRFRFENVQELTALKTRLTGLLDIVFPEYTQFFSSVHTKTSYALLNQYPSAFTISNTRVDSLQKLLNTYQHRFDALQLKVLAKSSIGTHSEAYTLQIKMLLQQILLLQTQNKTVETKLEVLLSSLNSTITSMPGVSTVLGAMILGEIQDISSYRHPDKLFAFAGLDAVVHQSGQFEATQVHMSKRGSPYLRYALMKAAAVAAHFDTTFNSYYTDKIQHGKHYFVAINHCARKFVRILYKILTENIPYVVQS